ncbi:MAG: ribonuclease III [Candidatus Brocadiaceae bacterium]
MSNSSGQLERNLGYQFRDRSVLRRALRHASAADHGPSNERLEFLGDAVLDLVVSELLYRRLPAAAEGELTVIRSAAVSREPLARVATSLELADYLEVDEGIRARPRYPSSILAGAYEAVAGAVFLDGGIEAAREFIQRSLAGELERARQSATAAGCKSILQEKTQAEGRGVPTYETHRAESPDHRPRFQAVVKIGGKAGGEGWGASKKVAEENAARNALDELYPGWRDVSP